MGELKWRRERVKNSCHFLMSLYCNTQTSECQCAMLREDRKVEDEMEWDQSIRV
jgi:hypothetical protein